MKSEYYDQLNKDIHAAGLSWEAAQASVSELSDLKKIMRLGCIAGPDKESFEERIVISKNNLKTMQLHTDMGIPMEVDWLNSNGYNYATGVRVIAGRVLLLELWGRLKAGLALLQRHL